MSEPKPGHSHLWACTAPLPCELGEPHDCARALTPERLALFAKRLLAELPRCTGCDSDHGWDDHVQAIFASTEEPRHE